MHGRANMLAWSYKYANVVMQACMHVFLVLFMNGLKTIMACKLKVLNAYTFKSILCSSPSLAMISVNGLPIPAGAGYQ